jgi:septal ring factor EnvC (AmiA/AmiB activator)
MTRRGVGAALRAIAPLAIALLVGGAVFARAQEASAPAADLDSLRAELRAKQAALSDLRTKEQSLIDGLGELDETLGKLDDERRAAEKRLKKLGAAIASLQTAAGLDEAELAQLRTRLQARLRQLAVDGEGGATRALLGAEGFTELALRRHLLRQLADNDLRLVNDVRRVTESVAMRRTELRGKLAEAEATKKLLAEQQALLAATRDERSQTLERVRGEKSLLRQSARELVERHRELGAFIAKLGEGARASPTASPTAAPQAARAGRGFLKQGLLWPLAEGVVIRRFGAIIDPDTRAEIVNNGLEFRSAPGTPVYAVAEGRVAHTGWIRGFGRVVIVDHGEGHHTLSAHLATADVATGDEVTRGQVIGTVGDTESTNGPKLYFELRESGRPRDPSPFLRR